MIQATPQGARENIAYHHLAAVEDTLRQMLDGGKPWLNPKSREQKWIFDQLARMHAGFLLAEEAKCYVTLPDDTQDIMPMKGDTSIHALGYPMAKSAQALRKHLTGEGLTNHRILGFSHEYRDTAKDPRDLLQGRGGVILSKGDIYSLWQMVTLLQDRLQNGKTDVPIIINNHRSHWEPQGRPMWEPFLNFCRDLNIDLPKLNIHRADTFGAVVETLNKHGRNLGQAPRHEPQPMVRPGATILVQTSNDKKIHELRLILAHHGIDAQVLPYNLLVDKPEEAKEGSATYSGNNNEKRLKADEKTDSLARAEIEARLKPYGADPDNTYVLLDDRGLDTAIKMFGSEEFERCAKYLNDYRHAPGPELANVLKAMSLTDFYGSIKTIVDRTPDVSLYSHDITCYMLTDLFPRKDGKRRVVTTFGATSDEIGFEPKPSKDPHHYSEHFLKPMNDARNRTKAQIPNYIPVKSSMARAGMALAALTGMESNRLDLTAKAAEVFNAAKSYGKWQNRNVLTHTGFFPASHGHGDKTVFKRLRRIFNIASGRSGHYDYTRAGVFTREHEDSKSTIHSNLNAFQRYLEEGDSFLFGPFPSTTRKSEDLILHKIYQFMSMTVYKQVFDPVLHPKFWGVFSDDWKEPCAIYDDFHRMGFIGQKPEHIYTDLNDANKIGIVNKISADLDKHFTTYHRLKYTQPKYVEKGVENRDLCRITIYCSATSTDERLLKDAHDLAYNSAALGFAVKNGGGTEGLMYQTSKGVHDFRRDAQKLQRQPVNGVYSVQYEYTMRGEGLCAHNDAVRVHPSIFTRIEDLQDTEVEIVLAGGAGTIQEIVGSMITRLNGTRPVQNRPLVIVNQKVGRKGVERGVYDKLLKHLPQTLMKKCNVQVVDTIEEALSIAVSTRKALGMAPIFRNVANDIGVNTPKTAELRA